MDAICKSESPNCSIYNTKWILGKCYCDANNKDGKHDSNSWESPFLPLSAWVWYSQNFVCLFVWRCAPAYIQILMRCQILCENLDCFHFLAYLCQMSVCCFCFVFYYVWEYRFRCYEASVPQEYKRYLHTQLCLWTQHQWSNALCGCHGNDRCDSWREDLREVLWGVWSRVTTRASPNPLSVYCLFPDLSPGNHHLHMWECPHQHLAQHTGRKHWNPAVWQTLSTVGV